MAVHLDLINLFVVQSPGKHFTRDDIEAAVPGIRELTRRLRELRTAEWGNYNVRCDGKKGYVYAPDTISLSEEMQRRRRYLEAQAKLPG